MTSPRKHQQPSIGQSRQRGMTLIEVLVTVIIISVGLLGVAALQLTSLRNNYDAYVRSQAAVLAGDILDRMRANRDDAMSSPNPYAAAAVVTSRHTATTTVVDRDVTDWDTTLRTQLPNGEGSVTQNADGTVTVVVQWSERDNLPATPFTTFTTNSAI